MINLTISVDANTLKQARIRALQQGTSVNVILRDYLSTYAGSRKRRHVAVKRILELSSGSISRRGDRHWRRDELHERDA
ncbi:MAG: hypothetical protein L0I62_10555 [Gammaproteobacteria bacterium]|nr:hypothetical protein [Gammaproteobacteria bacterium]